MTWTKQPKYHVEATNWTKAKIGMETAMENLELAWSRSVLPPAIKGVMDVPDYQKHYRGNDD